MYTAIWKVKVLLPVIKRCIFVLFSIRKTSPYKLHNRKTDVSVKNDYYLEWFEAKKSNSLQIKQYAHLCLGPMLLVLNLTVDCS